MDKQRWICGRLKAPTNGYVLPSSRARVEDMIIVFYLERARANPASQGTLEGKSIRHVHSPLRQ
jgi:hypothetical protein